MKIPNTARAQAADPGPAAKTSSHQVADHPQGTAPEAPTCDFCGAREPLVAVFGCDEFLRRILDQHGRVHVVVYAAGWWGACGGCAPLVRTGRWRVLVDRHLAQRRAAGLPGADLPHLREELTGLLIAVSQHLTGAERRYRCRRGAVA